jgi:hypothetical protein
VLEALQVRAVSCGTKPACCTSCRVCVCLPASGVGAQQCCAARKANMASAGVVAPPPCPRPARPPPQSSYPHARCCCSRRTPALPRRAWCSCWAWTTLTWPRSCCATG